MNDSFLKLHKTDLVMGVLWLALIGLMLSWPRLTSAQRQEQSPRRESTQRKLREHENAIVNRYIVVLRGEALNALAPEQAVAEIGESFTAAYDAQIKRTYNTAIKGYVMEMTKAQAEALSQDARVAYVEEDAEVRLSPVVADSSVESVQSGATWGLDRIDQRRLPLDQNYTANTSGRGVNVYILDSGIRRTHQEFRGRVTAAFDAINDGQNTNDCNGHGTHVAGTVGGATFGVAKNVSLHSVRVLNCENRGSLSGIIAGVDWVTANHIKPAVANMSLGSAASEAVDQAVKNSIAAGVTYVVAAMNENKDACGHSPARTENTITVGATTSSDSRSSFSNFGRCVNIFAPGSRIVSASFASDSGTAVMDGTSMASPHVAGVAALYLEANPRATPAEVSRAILGNATVGLVSDTGAGSPNLLLFSQLDGGAPCTGCTHYSGALSYAGQAAFEPDGTYYYASYGYHKGWLRGPAAADFDLYLWRWNGWQWEVVATSESGDATEELSYYGTPGYYSWRVYAFRGAGTYNFWLQRP